MSSGSASLGESVGIVTGLIFVACVLLFRRGIVGEIGAWLGALVAEEKARKRARVMLFLYGWAADGRPSAQTSVS